VTGHLAYWDELRRRRPQMLLDTCASGGKRTDLESLRRAVPLWRTDFKADTSADQCIAYGISFWIPYSGSGVNRIDPYLIRSRMASCMGFDLDPRRGDLDVDLWRRLVQQHKQLAGYYLGDYYPLTPYSLEPDVWIAWQFDCPDTGEGVVQAFRREESPDNVAVYRLRGLQVEATYAVTDLDSEAVQHLSGHTLTEDGLRVEMNTRPAAVIFRYRKL
jgi:alpha-galactosidase